MNVSLRDRAADTNLCASLQGAAVRLRQISKGFGSHQVLRAIDLDIPPGQFVAIVGRSGCGKSTLLRLLAGLDQPSAGQIQIGEQPGFHGKQAIEGRKADWKGQVRLMFQEPRLLPWQRVIANVEIGLSHASPGEDRRRRAFEAIAQVGLAGRESAWPTILSGGQKQRVALARALVSDPRVLAFDEPLGALDALTRIEMQTLIEDVWQDKGFTAVVVTHDVAEAVALADRILLLQQGQVVMDVTVDLPRPRRRGDPAAAKLVGGILDRLLSPAVSFSDQATGETLGHG